MSRTAEGLTRGIRRRDLIALFINVTVGAGVFRLPSDVYNAAGTYSLFAYLICAVAVGLIVICFAEVASRFTETGGPYLYGREAFGPLTGFLIGWLMWLTRLAGLAFLCDVFLVNLEFFWPAAASGFWHTVIIGLIVISLTVVNITGLRESIVLGNFFTVGKLVPLIAFIVIGLFFINPSHFSFAVRPSAGSFSHSVFILVFVFSGFEAVLINSGEIKDPQRDIPFSLIIALAAVALLFILIQVVCIGTLPGLAGSERPLADAASNFIGPVGASIITAGALISVIGTLNAVFLCCTRLPFAMAEQKQLPAVLTKTHQRFRTPYIAILVTAALVLALTLSHTFTYVLTLSVISRIMIYASTCIALPVFRRRSNRPAFFKAPVGVFVSVIAVILCVWLLSNSGRAEVRDLGIAIVIGLVFYFVTSARNHGASEFTR